MTTVFCTRCWASNAWGSDRCRRCGAPLAERTTYVAGLITALDHPEPSTQVRAASLLGQLRARAAVEPLRAVLRRRTDPYLLEAAAIALGQLGDPAATPELVELLGWGPLIARHAAVRALQWLGGQEAEAALARAAYSDPNASVRQAAAEVLDARSRRRPDQG